jgi:hypothetical protein
MLSIADKLVKFQRTFFFSKKVENCKLKSQWEKRGNQLTRWNFFFAGKKDNKMK